MLPVKQFECGIPSSIPLTEEYEFPLDSQYLNVVLALDENDAVFLGEDLIEVRLYGWIGFLHFLFDTSLNGRLELTGARYFFLCDKFLEHDGGDVI